MNGRVYSDDPTIMSWQLANEPRPGSDANGDSRTSTCSSKWIDETAGFIKKLAPKQLVSTGNEGWMGTAGSRELFVKSHATKNVDYLTFHMWAPNWSWFNPKKAAATYDGAWTKMQDYLNWHIDTANKMGKPIVLEEFGINRDDGSFRPARHDDLSRQVLHRHLWPAGAARGGRRCDRGLELLGLGRRGPHAATRISCGRRATASSAIRRRNRRGSTACSTPTRRRSRIIAAHARQMSGLH